MGLTRGFFDAECPKCKRMIGWSGTLIDRPACPECGHTVPPDALASDAAKIEEMSRQMHAEADLRDYSDFANANPEQLRLYTEGQDAADKADTRGHPFKVSPMKVPSPYYATKTSDRKFWESHHRWWMNGWHDACRGIDRRKHNPQHTGEVSP